MNVAELDEVQYDLDVDGEQVRKQLSRRVWERAGWATVAIEFAERKGGDWNAPKVVLFRFRRIHDVWQRQAQITVSKAEALELASWLSGGS